MALKIGAEDRKKVAVAAGLGLVVLLLAAKTIFGGPDSPAPAPTPGAAPASATAAPTTAVSTTTRTQAHTAPSAQLDPQLHPAVMAENEAFVYSGSGRSIFSLNTSPSEVTPVKIEKPRGPIRPGAPQTFVAQGPPPPPTIDLRFFGYSARKDGSRKAFLLHGDDVFIASEGDVVSHRYRVVRIAPTSVQVEDLPYHNTQSLPLIQN